jgi:hypothetical protein
MKHFMFLTLTLKSQWREQKMFLNRPNSKRGRINCGGFAMVIVIAIVIIVCYQSASAADLKQRMFKSPDEAVKALIESVRAKDRKELLAIFGPSGKEIISSGDEVADREIGERFVKAYEEANKVVSEGDKRIVLHVGKENYPFPIPIVMEGEIWFFDTKAGKEEILNRRIGRNELSTIQVSLAYVDAQREYARKDRDGGGLMEYAQKFISEKGKKDGLYWETKEGEEQSPLGPFVANAIKEGYTKKGDKPIPYHGYYFRILKAQGKNAPDGEYDYVVKGRMIGGFGLVAFPAEYGVSGVMTFIVNHDGVVCEKDLGKVTEKVAGAMKKFDPDKTWKRVE